MRLTQGTFSFLPDLTEEEIRLQAEYCLAHGWALGIEYTDDPHPRNTFWEMFGPPDFDQRDAAAILARLDECRRTFPHHYIKISAFDNSRGRETVALSFIVHRPAEEPGFQLVRQEGPGRAVRYTVSSYAANQPSGQRYRRREA
jgi:ribulose-bisphosphate carboxylase small chain